MSRPSQSFLIVTIDTSRRRTSSRLYTVDGVMPEIFANSFTLILRSAQITETLSATASFTAIRSPHGDCKKIYATAYTHLRIFQKCCILLSSRKQRSFRYRYYSQTALVNRSAKTGKRPSAAENGLPHHCRRTFTYRTCFARMARVQGFWSQKGSPIRRAAANACPCHI